jgi:sugar phosphate isomerase/epimerase
MTTTPTTTPPFGVQSYCFRHFQDNAQVAQLVRAIGLTKIELCGVHANFNDPAAFGAVVTIYREAGVDIVSLGVQTFVGDASEENWFRCAQIAGARHISCHFTASTFLTAVPKVRAWCRQYGIRVGIHCHGGYNFNGNVDTLKYLLSLGSPEIGVCIDTAWAMQIGPRHGNPVDWARNQFPGQVYGVHYKDFVFERNGAWRDVVVGSGNLDLPAFNAALRDTGFDGMAVIEYEADVENPAPALSCCVQAMLTNLG